MAVDVADELSEYRPRPWPLAERREALLIDLDNRRRYRHDLPRRDRLIRIEPRRLQWLRERRSDPYQDRESDEQRDCDEAYRRGPPRGGRRSRGQAHNSISIP